MEIDLNRIDLINSSLEFAITHAKKLYSEIAVNVIAPADNEYPQLEVHVLKNSSEELIKNIRNLYDKINAIKEDVQNAENENTIIAEKLGDTIDVKEGLQYFETGLGQGNSGTITTDGIRPEDAQYVVDRIAIYADGMLIDNIGETGTDIEQCIMDYEEQYGDIEISYHISMIGENGSHNATGWLNREQVADGSLVGIEKINLEDAFKEIEEKYENYTEPVLEDVKRDTVTSENAGVMAGIVSDLKNTKNSENKNSKKTKVQASTTSNGSVLVDIRFDGDISNLKAGSTFEMSYNGGKSYDKLTIQSIEDLGSEYKLTHLTFDTYGRIDDIYISKSMLENASVSIQSEEYVNPAKRDDLGIVSDSNDTNNTNPTTTTTATTTAEKTTTTITGGTTTTTTTTVKVGTGTGSTTTTTVAPPPPTEYQISFQAFGEATDSIYFSGNISDLKKGSKIYLSNNKEKEIESVEDIGSEYKITYRGPFGGWESIYIKKEQ